MVMIGYIKPQKIIFVVLFLKEFLVVVIEQKTIKYYVAKVSFFFIRGNLK